MLDRWNPNGPLLTFTAATTAPASVQVISLTGVRSNDVKIDNTSSTVDAVIGWSTTSSAQAIINASAAATVRECAMIQHGTIQVISLPEAAYVTGKTASSTAIIYVQTGIGA